MSEKEDNELKILVNRWAAEGHTHLTRKPQCQCVAQPNQLHSIHWEEQDTECEGWVRLLELIGEARRDGRSEFSPSRDMTAEQWAQLVTLPSEIFDLPEVTHLNVYGSSMIYIPHEIGRMKSLRNFTPYTSYRLHWFPYEITRCDLRDSTVSTRAIFGNYTNRMVFPKLPHNHGALIPKLCSICDSPMESSSAIQRWVSRGVGTDVLPLLVHACSQKCVDSIPKGAKNHVREAHCGGLGVEQPPSGF